MSAWRVQQACRVVSIGMRVSFAVAIIGGAVAGRGWWLLPFAVAGLVSTQPQNRAEALLLRLTRPLVLDSRVPWLLCCALALCLLNRPWEATWLTLAWVVVRLCAHVGEYAGATGMAVVESRFTGLLTTFIRPAAAFVVRDRARESSITIGAGIVAGSRPSSAPVNRSCCVRDRTSPDRRRELFGSLAMDRHVAASLLRAHSALAMHAQWWAPWAPASAAMAMVRPRQSRPTFTLLVKPSATIKNAWVDSRMDDPGKSSPTWKAQVPQTPMFWRCWRRSLDGHPGHADALLNTCRIGIARFGT